MTDLKIIVCERCGKKTAEEVIDYVEKLRKGWYCPNCYHWENSIARERKI
tara:strand:+ start:649 stop:798 length:150 start_codon:yes stop_codon:yes gene_type:complete